MPRSPYAAAKLYAFWITVNYREAYGIHASNGILFNHESPRRGATFVTRKITQAVAAIHQGRSDHLTLGNLDAQRDWGHARDYVEEAFSLVGHPVVWAGEGVSEIGVSGLTGRTIVSIDPKYFRPTEVELLRGDASKARRVLGWAPKVGFTELVHEMVSADLQAGKAPLR